MTFFSSILFSRVRYVYVFTGVLLLLGASFVVSPVRVSALGATLPVEEVLRLTNKERTDRRLSSLTENSTLKAVAQKKLLDLFTKQYFAHESPDGKQASDLAKEAGYDFLMVGENLAVGTFDTPEELVRAWMESKGHRENILNKNYQEIGIAVGAGRFFPAPFNGRKVWIAVQTFGTPKSVCGAIDSALYKSIIGKVQELDTLGRAIEEKRAVVAATSSRSRAVKKEIASFNEMVDSYNASVRLLRKEVVRYNKAVASYRSCVSTFIK